MIPWRAVSERPEARAHTPTAGAGGSTSLAKGPLRIWRRAWLALGIGLVLTAVAFVFTRGFDEDLRQLEFEQRARDVAPTLEAGVKEPLEAVYAVAAFVDAHGEPSEAEFTRFAAPSLERHPSIAALEWAPLVAAEGRAAFEQKHRKIIEPADGGMVSSPARERYFPILHMVPHEPSVMGLDVAFEPARLASVQKAIESGKAVVSPRFKLVEDPPGRFSVAVYLPVYRDPNDVRSVRGLAIGLLRLQPVVEKGLAGADMRGLQLALLDDSASGDLHLLFETDEGAAATLDTASLSWKKPLSYGDRSWSLAFVGTPKDFSGGAAAWSVLGLGLLLTFAVSGTLALFTHVRRLREQVLAARQLGQYTLLSKLGEGGMGAVYRAEHALLRRPTAVKLVQQSQVGREAVERFEREVRVTSQLEHPNTIEVYDFGLTPTGVFYYAMELLEGLDGEELVEMAGALPPGRVLYLMQQVCGSLAEAHAVGFIHRDIKPANLMVCDRGGVPDMVKVLDFGLVKLTQSNDAKLSVAGGLLGTPLYMAPEAMTAPDELTAAADVYSLGAVAYFLVSGREVFTGSTIVEVCAKHMTSKPPPPSRHKPCPEQLEALILRCLSKDPKDRPAHAGELLKELRKLEGIDPWSEDDAQRWWDEVGSPHVAERHPQHSVASGRQHTLAIDLEHR